MNLIFINMSFNYELVENSCSFGMTRLYGSWSLARRGTPRAAASMYLMCDLQRLNSMSLIGATTAWSCKLWKALG